jgi:colanic acid/amylovoran biosynthesis glycosyltransferase
MNVGFATGMFPKVTETFFINQVTGLLDMDHEVTVYAQARPETTVTHDVIDKYGLIDRTVYLPNPGSITEGVELLARSIPGLFWRSDVSMKTIISELRAGKRAPRRLSNLRSVLSREPDDVFHAHFGYRGNYFLGVAKCRDTPYVVSFYGSDASQQLENDPHRYDELFKYADAVTVLSEDMRSDLASVGCPRSKMYIQPLSVNTDRFTFQPRTRNDEETVKIVTVGRFVEKKGIEYALKAIATINEQYDLQYTLIGDGERRDRIEDLIVDLEIGDSVELLGWQPQSTVIDHMRDAHLFLLPSVTAASGDKEGTPTVLLEAQAMGLPVVTTHHAGIPEIVVDGDSGLLVPERDETELEAALTELLRNPDRWAEMGRRGRDLVESTHSIEHVSDRLVNLYRSL